MDGSEQERHLLNALGALGWTGVRSPASGTAPREQPDILVAKSGVVIAGELKSGDAPRNPTDREIQDLTMFGDDFDAASVIVARWKGDRAFYFAPPQALDRTDSGNYSIPGSPERWPFTASITYSIQSADDDGPAYRAQAFQQDVPDDIAGDDPLRAWAQNIAQAQILGADQALKTLGDRDGGDD